MKTIILFYIFIVCTQLMSCTNKSKHTEAPQPPVNYAIGINDTLGLSLHPERPVYSTKQKQITFILHNHSDANISFGGYYRYTYKDEEGIWRDVPMELIVFQEELVLFQGNEYHYNAELFRHTPGSYRFFLPIRKDNKEYTLMTEFQLSQFSSK